LTLTASGYRIGMRRRSRSRSDDPSDLWRETLWSLELIGSVLLVALLVAQLARV
jgi:hypothetical protein